MTLFKSFAKQLTKKLTACLLILFAINAHAVRTTTYYHTDGLGSVVAASDESGNLLWRKSYAPYGEQIDGNTDNEPVSYTGKKHDDVTGLTYFGARYYDPRIGRFMATDPVHFMESNPVSFNRYAYVNNNPYKYVDPDGKILFLAPLAIFILKEVAAEGLSIYTGGATDFLSTRRVAMKAGKFAKNKLAEAVQTANRDAAIKVALEKASASKISKEILISRAKYGEAADHIADAQKAGHPDILEIARGGASANRYASIGGLPKVSGKQLDEYPPAMFKEGGAGASVRAINSRDNLAAGACIGNSCRGLADGEKVRLKVVP